MSPNAVLLLAHGSPDSVDEIPEFLRQITRGRPIPPQVIEEVQHRYGLIGQSPLTRLTLRQGELLARELADAGLCRDAELEALYRRCGSGHDWRWDQTCGGDLSGSAEFPDQRGALSGGFDGGRGASFYF